MAHINPHPALKVAHESHGGWGWETTGSQRRVSRTEHALHLRTSGTRKNDEHRWTSHYDDYDMYLRFPLGNHTAAAARTSRLRQTLIIPATTRSGSSKPWIKSSPPSRSEFP